MAFLSALYSAEGKEMQAEKENIPSVVEGLTTFSQMVDVGIEDELLQKISFINKRQHRVSSAEGAENSAGQNLGKTGPDDLSDFHEEGEVDIPHAPAAPVDAPPLKDVGHNRAALGHRNQQNTFEGVQVRVEHGLPAAQTASLLLHEVPLQLPGVGKTSSFSTVLEPSTSVDGELSISDPVLKVSSEYHSKGSEGGQTGFDMGQDGTLGTASASSLSEGSIHQAQMIQQILADFKMQLGQIYRNTSRFSVQMNHQQLGKMNVGITIKDNKVLEADFKTSSSETSQILSQYKKNIEAIFHGYNLETGPDTVRIYELGEI